MGEWAAEENFTTNHRAVRNWGEVTEGPERKRGLREEKTVKFLCPGDFTGPWQMLDKGWSAVYWAGYFSGLRWLSQWRPILYAVPLDQPWKRSRVVHVLFVSSSSLVSYKPWISIAVSHFVSVTTLRLADTSGVVHYSMLSLFSYLHSPL